MTIYILQGADDILQPFRKLSAAYAYPIERNLIEKPLALSTVAAKLRRDNTASIEKDNNNWTILKTKLL